MRLFKCSLVVFMLSSYAHAFDANKCLIGDYQVDVVHKGQPFGLLPVILKVDKKGCILTFYHQRLKYLKENWVVDVCREPVHIKKGIGAVEVIKKEMDCDKGNSSSFCQEQNKIFQRIQDDGLIFAEGEKEDLKTSHGKTYCAYLLVKKYLDESLVFNRGQDYTGALSGAKNTTKETPVKEEEKAIDVEVVTPRPEVVGGQDETNGAPVPEPPVVEEKKEENGKGFF